MASDFDPGDLRILIDLLADRWTVPVLGALCAGNGTRRFNDLRRDIPAVSQKSLVVCLRRLEMHGLISRRVFTSGKLAVEYSVTTLGHTIEKPVEALLAWSRAHAAEVEAAKSVYMEQLNP